MHWKVAEAKQQLSEVLRLSADEPQLIFNRNRLVAAVVDGETFRTFAVWQREQQQRSLAEAFDALREIATEEDYVLAIPARQERPNVLPEVLDEYAG